jgi:hypothetical protein
VTRHYVDITSVPESDLETCGYYLVTRGKFALYAKGGDYFIVHVRGESQFIYVDDVNDAIILRVRPKLLAPPES